MRLLEAQQFLTQKRWNDAEPILTGIEAELHKETGFDELGNRVEELLKQCRKGRAIEEARIEGEERLQTFRCGRNDAMFHETHFTGLDLPGDKEAVRRSTWAALAVFARPGSENSLGDGRVAGEPCKSGSKKRSRKAATSFS